jgi:hypothetical protein
MSERELDQLLDAALPGYVADAPAGIEDRVLARVRPRTAWPWYVGLAAAAVLAIAVLVPNTPPIDGPPLVAVHAANAPAVQLTSAPPRVRRVSGPAPLTRRERVLIHFVQSHPELAQQIFVEAPKQMAQDLTIEPITIEPLATSSGGE